MLDLAQLASIGTFIALAAAIGMALWERCTAALPPSSQRSRKDQRHT